MNDQCVSLEQEVARLRQELLSRDDPQRRLLASEKMAILLVDPERCAIVAASPKAILFYGYSRNVLLGMTLDELELKKPDPEGAASKPVASRMLHIQHRLANGDVRDVRISTWPGWHDGREVITVLVIDITDQLKGMREIEAREKKFQELFKVSADFIFIVEINDRGIPLRVLEVNDYACKRMGFSREELLRLVTKENFQRIVDGDDFRRVMPSWLATGHITFESTLIARDGSTIPVEVKGSHFTYGQTKAALCILRDLSERKRSEAALRHSEERYRLLAEYAPYGVITYADDRIEYANPKAVQLLRADKMELKGQPIIQFATPESADIFVSCMQRMEQVDAIEPVEVDIRRSDGSVITVEAIGTAFEFEGRRTVQVGFSDITERKLEMARAIAIQSRMRRLKSPLPARLETALIYQPAKTISGDFYHFERLNDDHLIGLIGDGSGKGVAAALNISAVRIAFHESTMMFKEPAAILGRLNHLVAKHFEEDYVAACCFSIDFHSRKLAVASGGIYRFFHCGSESKLTQHSVPGCPLGMFEDSVFDQAVYDIHAGDQFWFYTDGLDAHFKDHEFVTQLASKASLTDQQNFMLDVLRQRPLDDDCTWLGMKIK